MVLTKIGYGLSGLLGAGIVFIGARFLIAPQVAAAGFGITTEQSGGVPDPYLAVKGVRDIASGIVVFFLLAAGKPRILGGYMNTTLDRSAPAGDTGRPSLGYEPSDARLSRLGLSQVVALTSAYGGSGILLERSRLPCLTVLHRVLFFTNPCTRTHPHLPVPVSPRFPRSCQSLAVADVSRLAKRPRSYHVAAWP